MIAFRSMTVDQRRVFWDREFDAYSKSGKSTQAFCRERGYSYSAFANWRKKRSNKPVVGDTNPLVAIPFLTPGKASRKPLEAISPRFQIRINGVDLEFAENPSPEWLARFVGCLNSGQSEVD